MNELTAIQRDILYILLDTGGMSGASVKEELESYYDSTVYDGQLYPALRELRDKGLLLENNANGRKKIYRLSKRGEYEVDFRNEWEAEMCPSELTHP